MKKNNSINYFDFLEEHLKGGSWENTIDKTQFFTLPDPRVGFRVNMEMVEE